MDKENSNNMDNQDENLNVHEQFEEPVKAEQPAEAEHPVETEQPVQAELSVEAEQPVKADQSESSEQNLQEKPKRKSFFNTFFGRLLVWIVVVALLFVIVVILPPTLQNIAVPISTLGSSHVSEKEAAEMAESKDILEKSIAKLDQQLDALVPKDCYMIINSTDNVFTLKKGNEIVRTGKCSTGSYLMLESEKKQKKWLFKTPKGVRTIKSKKTNPVWTKPDWAFIEEGLPVPGPNHPSRFEDGVLGDYALVLGDGYMIHGTLWQRYLGLSVTHGCVRLNDADLEAVYKNLNKGSKVFIY
jgi:L,D-transpeptidase ErfK/SrfK